MVSFKIKEASFEFFERDFLFCLLKNRLNPLKRGILYFCLDSGISFLTPDSVTARSMRLRILSYFSSLTNPPDLLNNGSSGLGILLVSRIQASFYISTASSHSGVTNAK